MKERKKYISKDDAIQKLQHFCAYQDRCHAEVRQKLIRLGVYGDELEEIIATLIEENFLNEERFARSYVRGKFRMRQWGRQRIVRELKTRNISAYCIRKGLEEIEEETYQKVLLEVLEKKKEKTIAVNTYSLKNKVAAYAIQRGYEPDLVWKLIPKIIEE